MAHQLEQKTIYEIFRSCRFCGAGDGFKMPIIQSAIGIDISEINLRHKIRECVQIEVQEEDRMPPLICEQCIDKFNDYYAFLDLCRRTNRQTRLRLGLPLQSVAQGNVNNEDCILGDTEPVYIKNVAKPGPKSKKMLAKEKVAEDKILKEKDKILKEKEKILKDKDKTLKELKEKMEKNAEEMQKKIEMLKKDEAKKIEMAKKEEAKKIKEEVQKKIDVAKKEEAKKIREEMLKKIEITKKEEAKKIRDEMQKKIEGEAKKEEKTKKEEIKKLKAMEKEIEDLKNQVAVAKKAAATASAAAAAAAAARPIRARSSSTSSPSSSPLCPREPRRSRVAAVGPKRYLSRSPSTSSRSSRLSPASSRETRRSVVNADVHTPTENRRIGPRILLKKEKIEEKVLKDVVDSDDEMLSKSVKRTKEVDQSKAETPAKKIKLTIKLNPPSTPPSTKPGPKSKKIPQPSPPSPPATRTDPKTKKTQPVAQETPPRGKPGPKSKKLLRSMTPARLEGGSHTCQICDNTFKTVQALTSHLRIHTVSFSGDSEPEVECNECSKKFPTDKMMAQHQCGGSTVCPKCDRAYSNYHNMKRHLKKCTGPTDTDSTDVKVSPKLRKEIRDMQVRVTQCDGLMTRGKARVNVSTVPSTYGLDRSSVYPYFPFKNVKIKREPLALNNMVSIRQEIREEFYKEEDYVHWDTDISSDSDDGITSEPRKRKVPSLTALTLKTIYSKRCLGKVPKKLRKVRSEKLFDSIFNETELRNDIDNLIGNLDSTMEDDDLNVGNNSVKISDCITGDDISANKDVKDQSQSDSLIDDKKNDSVDTEVNSNVTILNCNNEHKANTNCKEETEATNDGLDGRVTNLSDNLDHVNQGSPSCINDLNVNGISESRTDQANAGNDNINTNPNTDNANDISSTVNQENSTNNVNPNNDDDGATKVHKIDEHNDDNSQSTDATEADTESQNGENCDDTQKVTKTNGNTEQEIDSNTLLAELDAQIGEGGKIGESYETEKDANKVSVMDLIKDKNTSEYDCISDTEFNFDL